MNISWIGCSPSNFTTGREGITPNVIICHWMAGRLAATDATFQDGRRQASAHYGIEDSTIHQYVKEDDTSYNAGVWEVNLRSISIEHSGGPNLPISEETYDTSVQLITKICLEHGIPADTDHIKKHSDFKATQCPGTLDVNRIILAVAKNLTAPVDPMKQKNDYGSTWGVMELQAAISKLNDLSRDLTAAQEKGKILDGFVSKWVAQWNMPVGSSLVEVEAEMAKLMPAEESVQIFRDSIEACVGEFPKDDLLLEAHKTVRKQMSDLNGQVADLQQKLSDAKTPVGYKFVKSWDIFNLRWKLYRKDVK
jgi:hypothetical protein